MDDIQHNRMSYTAEDCKTVRVQGENRKIDHDEVGEILEQDKGRVTELFLLSSVPPGATQGPECKMASCTMYT